MQPEHTRSGVCVLTQPKSYAELTFTLNKPHQLQSTVLSIMASSAFPPEPLAVIAQEVSDLLKEKGESVAVAETVRLSDRGAHPPS